MTKAAVRASEEGEEAVGASAAATVTSHRPLSQLVQSLQHFPHNYIRDQLTLPDWFICAFALQSLAFVVLPYRPITIAIPSFALAITQLLRLITSYSRYDPDRSYDGRPGLNERKTARIDMDRIKSGEGGVCVLLLGFRSHHPLGMLAPGLSEIGKHLEDMIKDLEVNAEQYGFRGGKVYMAAADAKTQAEIVTLCYFQDHHSIHEYAHGVSHMKGWNWWNQTVKKHPHIGLMHEIYDAPAHNWETIYVNYVQSGLGACSYPVQGKEGNTEWMSMLVDAGKRAQ